MGTDITDISQYPLTNEEFMCLVIRECATRGWSGHRKGEPCRFCDGVLFSARDLREANMVLNDEGRPIPKEG